jgi:hypothetical protein
MQRSLLILAIVTAAVGTAAVAQTSSSPGNTPSTGTPALPSDKGGGGNSPGAGGPDSSNAAVEGNGGSSAMGNRDKSAEAPNMANSTGEQPSGAALTAKKAIERDGYKDVQGIAKGSDGLWHAQAMRGTTRVQVTVDRSGMVSAR